MKKLYGILSGLCFILLLGFIGGIETGGPLIPGMILSMISLFGFTVFAAMAGAFRR